MRWVVAVLLAALASSSIAQSCRIQTQGSSCVAVPQAQRYVSPYIVGDTLPIGDYQMLFNATYCGLPPAQDGWVYFRVERDVMRVDRSSMRVLGIVTDQVSRSCR